MDSNKLKSRPTWFITPISGARGGIKLLSVAAKLIAVGCLLLFPLCIIGQSTPIEKAKSLVNAQRYGEAMDVFESVVASDAQNQAARTGEIDAASKAALDLRKKGQMEDALAVLLRARKAVGDDPVLLFEVGLLENQMHLNHDADDSLHKALLLRPNDPATLYAVARVKMELGQLPDAEAAMRSYLQQRPDDASAHYGLGRILLISLNNADALQEFQRSIALHPNQSESYYEIGEIALQAGDLDKAAENYQICLKRDPNHGGALTGMGIVAFRRKEYQEAEDYLRRGVRADPAFQTAHYYLGLTLAKLGQKEESEAELATAVKMANEENARKNAGVRLAPQ
jgi:tetratricopeptide (TPR) repeat protein